MFAMLSPYPGCTHAYSPVTTVSMECGVFANTGRMKAWYGVQVVEVWGLPEFYPQHRTK